MLVALLMGLTYVPQIVGAEGVRLARAGSETAGAALPKPAAWQPSRGRECRNRGRYKRFCAGPRRVAAPRGAAGRLGQQLGLGSRKAASQLLLGSPDPEWVAHAPPAAAPGLAWPVDEGKFWRGFGNVRRGPKRKQGHKGIDVGATESSPIRAVQSGIVAYADNELTGYGNVLMVIHADGSVALYAHCKAIFVFAGQTVERGQIVALVGHTGIARGTHLHFEYRRRGRPRDPLPLFTEPPQSAFAAIPHRRRNRAESPARSPRSQVAAKSAAATSRSSHVATQ